MCSTLISEQSYSKRFAVRCFNAEIQARDTINNMQRPGLFHICLILLLTCHVLATPLDYSNPKSQVEYISVQAGGEKPNFVPITRPPLLNQTPPPPPANSKNFAYNPASETWTQLGPRAPKPAEETLVWNQSNDKWLTNVAGS